MTHVLNWYSLQRTFLLLLLLCCCAIAGTEDGDKKSDGRKLCKDLRSLFGREPAMVSNECMYAHLG